MMNNKMKTPNKLDGDTNRTEVIEAIMLGHLRFETVETRNRDALDFKESAVWEIRTALERAYEAGRRAGR